MARTKPDPVVDVEPPDIEPPAPPEWANRIVGYEPAVDPAQLFPHEKNARVHDDDQSAALGESLGKIGWVGVVLVNRRTGKILDGHLRARDALAAGAPVPVLYVDIDESEEAWVLATLDPIAGMAGYSGDQLTALLDEVQIGTAPLADMLAGMLQLEAPNLDDLFPGGPNGAEPDPLAPPPPAPSTNESTSLCFPILPADRVLVSAWLHGIRTAEGLDSMSAALVHAARTAGQ